MAGFYNKELEPDDCENCGAFSRGGGGSSPPWSECNPRGKYPQYILDMTECYAYGRDYQVWSINADGEEEQFSEPIKECPVMMICRYGIDPETYFLEYLTKRGYTPDGAEFALDRAKGE